MGKNFGAQGQVTPKQIVLSDPESTSFKILCLSSLSTRLMKIQSKLKALSCPQHIFWHSRAGNSEVNGCMWPEFQLVQDFMAVLIICKFDEDTIKNEGPFVSTTFSPL